jgi:hypothetical protein
LTDPVVTLLYNLFHHLLRVRLELRNGREMLGLDRDVRVKRYYSAPLRLIYESDELNAWG